MKLAQSLIACGLVLVVAGLGFYGMGRSLWLDEAWVANSIQEASISSMFHYPGWLQLSPPFFLLLARGAVQLLGPSNIAFRIVPLLLAGIAAAAVLAVGKRLLQPSLALLAVAIIVLDPAAIEYSRTFKPYSGELAASAILLLTAAVYLQRPDRKRFGLLLAAAAVSLPLAYPSVFLLPGIAIAVTASGPRSRGLWIAAIAAAELPAMYWLTIRPNSSLQLRDFWAVDVDHGMTAGLLAALLFCVGTAIRLAIKLAQGKPSPRDWNYLICVSPCLLLAVGGAMGLYPVSHRTRLFALPCFVLLAAMTAEDLLKRFWSRRSVEYAAAGLAIGLAGYAIANQVIEGRDMAEEDYAGAVSFLQQRAGADLILVHACCKEGFELYSRMSHWNPHVLFGDTGWPCCARDKDSRPGVSTEQAVIADIDSKIPRGYTGRVWLFYTTRPTQWTYVGHDEGEIWRKHLWDRGCPPGPYLRFTNLTISPMNCAGAR